MSDDRYFISTVGRALTWEMVHEAARVAVSQGHLQILENGYLDDTDDEEEETDEEATEVESSEMTTTLGDCEDRVATVDNVPSLSDRASVAGNKWLIDPNIWKPTPEQAQRQQERNAEETKRTEKLRYELMLLGKRG